MYLLPAFSPAGQVLSVEVIVIVKPSLTEFMEISFNNIPPGNYFCGSSYLLSEQGWFLLQQSIQLPVPRILLIQNKQTTNSWEYPPKPAPETFATKHADRLLSDRIDESRKRKDTVIF
jgi:hypothetical protein